MKQSSRSRKLLQSASEPPDPSLRRLQGPQLQSTGAGSVDRRDSRAETHGTLMPKHKGGSWGKKTA
ncbi:MAG: hypothetical protein ABI778_01030 [Ignavibacteriota bacterium]